MNRVPPCFRHADDVPARTDAQTLGARPAERADIRDGSTAVYKAAKSGTQPLTPHFSLIVDSSGLDTVKARYGE